MGNKFSDAQIIGFIKEIEGGATGTPIARRSLSWKRSSRSAGSRSSLARGIEGAIPVPLATGASSS